MIFIRYSWSRTVSTMVAMVTILAIATGYALVKALPEPPRLDGRVVLQAKPVSRGALRVEMRVPASRGPPLESALRFL